MLRPASRESSRWSPSPPSRSPAPPWRWTSGRRPRTSSLNAPGGKQVKLRRPARQGADRPLHVHRRVQRPLNQGDHRAGRPARRLPGAQRSARRGQRGLRLRPRCLPEADRSQAPAPVGPAAADAARLRRDGHRREESHLPIRQARLLHPRSRGHRPVRQDPGQSRWTCWSRTTSSRPSARAGRRDPTGGPWPSSAPPSSWASPSPRGRGPRARSAGLRPVRVAEARARLQPPGCHRAHLDPRRAPGEGRPALLLGDVVTGLPGGVASRQPALLGAQEPRPRGPAHQLP